MTLGGYYHAIILSPCVYARPLYGENAAQDSEYWRHADGAQHLATQLMSRYCNLNVYGFQTFSTVSEDAWTDVDQLNACFFSQASRIVLFVPSGGEELISHFTRVCLMPLLTRPKTSGGRPNWHTRFVAAAIGNVRVPNQLSQDVPFINVVRFREIGWMRDVTAITLLHRAIRDFWTPFDEGKQNLSTWTLSPTPKADYSLVETIETAAWVGTHTLVTGRMDEDCKVSEVSEFADVLQSDGHRVRSRTRSGKSRSRSRSRQTNSSGYRSLEPEFEALQTDERLLDTRVILSVLPSHSLVPLPGPLLNGFTGTISREHLTEAGRGRSSATGSPPSLEAQTSLPAPREQSTHRDSAWSTETLYVNKHYEASVNGSSLLDATHQTDRILTTNDSDTIAGVSSENSKPLTLPSLSGTVAKLVQPEVNGSLQTTLLEAELNEEVAEAVGQSGACVGQLKVTLVALTPPCDRSTEKQRSVLTTQEVLTVNDVKSEIVRSAPTVEASSFMMYEPQDIGAQYTRSEISQTESRLTVESSLLASIPFIDASSHSEGSGTVEPASSDAKHRILMTRSLPSSTLERTNKAAVLTEASREPDAVDSVHKKSELNQPEKRYPRKIKIIRRSGTVTLHNIDSRPESSRKEPDHRSTICFSRPAVGKFTRPLVTVSSAYTTSVIFTPRQQSISSTPRKDAENPKAIGTGPEHAQATTQTETERIDKTVTEPKTTVYKKIFTRKEFISESLIIETMPEQSPVEEMSNEGVQRPTSLESAVTKRSEPNGASSDATTSSFEPWLQNGALQKASHAEISDCAKRAKKLRPVLCAKETYPTEAEPKQEGIANHKHLDSCLTLQTKTEPQQAIDVSKIAKTSWRIAGAYALACLTVLFSALVAYYSILPDRKILVTPEEFWRWLCSAASRFTPDGFEQD